MRKILVLPILMVPFLSNATEPNFRAELIVLKEGESHQCPKNLRPVSYSEAIFYSKELRVLLESTGSASIASPWAVNDSQQDIFLTTDSPGRTLCYPNPTNSPPKFDINLASLQKAGPHACYEQYRPLTGLEASKHRESLGLLTEQDSSVSIEFPLVIMGSDNKHIIKEGHSDSTWCYPLVEDESVDELIIYENNNNKGKSLRIRSDLSDLGAFNGNISSVYLPKGWTVIFYEEINYAGTYYTIKDSKLSLSDFGNKVHSVKISKSL